MFDTGEKRWKLYKWFIGLFTCCILIYLGFSNISSVMKGIGWLTKLAKPLIIGAFLALVFNVPMSSIERNIRKGTKLRKGIRVLSITLSLILVFGMFLGVIGLVVPELIEAIRLIIQILGKGLDQLAKLENNSTLVETPIGAFVANLDVDWLKLKSQMEAWVRSQSGVFVNHAVGAAGSIVGNFVSLSIGFVFALYILASKETLKSQTARLLRAWLPEKISEPVIHVFCVFSHTFHLFIAGQATEAVILGTLCMIGMAILKIPYAPMVGALIGVTALIPVVGAFVGTVVGTIMILTVNPLKAVIFDIFLAILQQVEGNLIYPRVVGSKINLPAIWVLAAVTIGGNLGGPLGMLLGVPAASAVFALVKEATRNQEKKKARNSAAVQSVADDKNKESIKKEEA
ncbi:MAG: AI-2E family transporter [Clostridiales bacterium]|nr:AI-2E family transporter [Clostridiales bacterium]